MSKRYNQITPFVGVFVVVCVLPYCTINGLDTLPLSFSLYFIANLFFNICEF